MPESETPVTLKADMLAEVLTDLPEGVRNFLSTPLPAGPTLTTPNSVDNAIICQAEFCVWLAGLFGAYEGLTPIAIPMWIGQLNSVQQAMLLASLEYDAETQAAQDFEILEPRNTTYYPGNLRIRARAVNGVLAQCVVEIGDRAPLVLDDNDGTFEGHLEMSEPGTYTASVTGMFDNEATQTLDVSFTISELEPGEQPEDPETPQPEVPEGDDQDGLQQAYESTAAMYKQLMRSVITWAAGSDVKDLVTEQYRAWKNQTNIFLQSAGSQSPSAEIVAQHAQQYESAWPAVAELIYTENINSLEERIPAVQSIGDHLMQALKSL